MDSETQVTHPTHLPPPSHTHYAIHPSRVAMGVSSTEYFCGRRYKCSRCKKQFTSYMNDVMDMWLSHKTKARYSLSIPVVMTHKCALTRDAYDLMRTLTGGTAISITKCASVFSEMHSRTLDR